MSSFDEPVPDRFFEFVFDPVKIESIKYWMPQDEDSRDQVNNYVPTLDFIEQQTGFDLLAELNDLVEVVVKSSTGVVAN